MSYLTEDWLAEQQRRLQDVQREMQDILEFFRSAGESLPLLAARLETLQRRIAELDQATRAQQAVIREEGDRQLHRFRELLEKAIELTDAKTIWELREGLEAIRAERQAIAALEQRLTEFETRYDERLAALHQRWQAAEEKFAQQLRELAARNDEFAQEVGQVRSGLAAASEALVPRLQQLEARNQAITQQLERFQHDVAATVDTLMKSDRELAERVDDRARQADFLKARQEWQAGLDELAKQLALRARQAELAEATLQLEQVRKTLDDFLHWFDSASVWRRLIGRQRSSS